jgi:hypothetical protein
VLSYAPSLALITLALVMMLVLQQRSAAAGRGVAPRPKRAGAGFAQADLDAADHCLVRQVGLSALTNLGAYLAFVLALDVHLRAQAAGLAPGLTLYLGAGAALAVALAGRLAARRAAWSGFSGTNPHLWAAEAGLNGGQVLRSTASYLAWREGAADESP